MRKFVAVPVATAGLVVFGVSALAVPANAGDATAAFPLTQAGMASASLRASDIPKALAKDPKRSLSYTTVPKTHQFEMCVDKNGKKVFGARPLQHENSSVVLSQTGSGDNITATVAVSSDIYGYSSTASCSGPTIMFLIC